MKLKADKLNGRVSHFKLLEREKEQFIEVEGETLAFGKFGNLKISRVEYRILDDRYEQVKQYLDFIADKIYGKKPIKNPLSYILTVARNEHWPEKKKNKLDKEKIQAALEQEDRERRDQEHEEWYARKREEYGVQTNEEVLQILKEQNPAQEARKKLINIGAKHLK